MRYYVILLFDSMKEHPLPIIRLKLNKENRKSSYNDTPNLSFRYFFCKFDVKRLD